ncbi:Ig-like domain-containing protein [Georgenia sp. AZ-5]|uniref:Ig-like domain-containing protein n=1 Tax=Georgenia sp. AZ-5 TaxID=3367526 RepID=UPI0037547E56
MPGRGARGRRRGEPAASSRAARTARGADRRRRTLSAVVLSLVTAAVAVAGLLYDGVAAADVDLNDGGVWVTSSTELRVGRVNYPVQQLDGSVTATSADLDVLQEGADVFVVDHGAGLLQRLDPATVSVTGGVPLPAQRQVALGGGVVALLDVGTGTLRAAPTTAVGALEEGPALASLGAGAHLAVGTDGTVYGVSTADATVVAIPEDAARPATDDGAGDAETDEPQALGLGVPPGTLAGAQTQVTAVGGEPVVLTRTTDGRLLLLRPGEEPADLTGLEMDATQVALQQAGGDADHVVLAAADALVRVPLDGRAPVVTPVPVLGPPAAPVVVAGCTHAAWSGGTPTYLQQCGDGEPVHKEVPTTATATELSFRTNRDLVVLNDTLSGGVYLVNESMTIVDNWDDVTPPEADDGEEESQQDVTDAVPLDREAENRPPAAQDDDHGVRPGSTTVLEVLANDTDPDGDLLTVTGYDAPPEAVGTVRPVMGGRALQAEVPADATGTASFAYTIDDGRGGEASATATLLVVPQAVNNAPEPVRPTRMTLTAGATGSVDVLTDVRDPDGDALVVTDVTWDSDDAVRHTPDGVVTFEDRGTAPGPKEVTVTVSDARASTDVTVEVDVRAEAALPPVPLADYVTAKAGQEVVVEPIRNDADPDGEALRLANVAGATGASVVADYDAGTFRFSSDVVGAHYLTYVVVDDSGTGATGLVRVQVTERTEAPPVAVRDSALLPAGGSVAVDVLANDEDPSGRLLAVQQVDVPEGSGLVVAVVEHRVLRISARKAPATATPVRYTVSNGTATAQGEVVLLPVATDASPPPPAAEPDVANVRAGDFVTVPVLQNDSHPAGLELTLDPTLAETAEQGLFFVSGDTVRFRAPEQPQTVHAVYRVTDSLGNADSAQVTVHVQADAGTNSAPLPVPVETRAFGGERVRIQVPMFGIDPDGDSVQLLGAHEAPRLGRIVDVGPGYLDYEAYRHANGTDEFTYAVRDRLGMVAHGDVSVGVVPPPETNRSPQAHADTLEVRPGRLVRADVLANDTDPDGDRLHLPADAPFEPVEGVAIEAVDGGLEITTPEEATTFSLAYRVGDARGGVDSGVLTVRVSPDAPLQAPLARDDQVQAADIIGRDTVTVPVLANDDDPDGTAAALEVTLPGQDGATVAGDRVRAPVLPSRHVLTYQVQDVDGNSAYAFVDVPGVADTGPVLRTDTEPVETVTGRTVQIDLADHVLAPSGREVRLTDVASVTATNSDGRAPVVDGDTLRFTSAAGYAGPASITFEVTDGATAEDGTSSVLTLPITVLPDGDNAPPEFAGGSVEVAPAEGPAGLNLRDAVTDPDTQDLNRLEYDVVEVPEGFEATVDGPFLSVSAAAGTRPGTTGDVVVSVADPVNEPVTGTVSVSVVPSTRGLAVLDAGDLGTVDQGETVTAPVLEGAYNPFPDVPLEVLSAQLEAGRAEVTSTDAAVSVTPAADFVGRVVVRYTVQDATRDPSRHVEGRVTMDVVGVPDRPAPPRVEEVRDSTVVLSWSAPASNGSPITGYTVRAPGTTTSCATTTCTITGLTNDVEHAFTVTATNEAGDSEPSAPSAPARPDVRPERPAPPVLTSGDGALRVDWSAPRTSGSPVTSYDLRISPALGSGQVGVTGTSHTWTGLTNGREYRVQVRARSSAPEPSDWSAWSAGEVPAGVPDAPSAPRVQRVDNPVAGQIHGTWDAPHANGDAVSEYRVRIDRDGARFREFTVPASTRSFTEDAPAGSAYTVTVAARNKAGWGADSPASRQVRSFLRPSVPGVPAAEPTGEDGEVRLRFTDAHPNGDPVEGYQVSVNGGGWAPLPADRVVRDLTNGSLYSFRVRAVNTYQGDASRPSDPASPYGPLRASMQASAGPNSVTLAWSGADGNGRPVVRQQLCVTSTGGLSECFDPGTAGSRTYRAPKGTVFDAELRVTRLLVPGDERTTSVRAGATTHADTRVRVSRTREAVGEHGCEHGSCAFLDADYHDLPRGAYRVTFFARGERVHSTANGQVHQLEGSGRLETPMYRGYPREEVRVVLDGPVWAEHTLVWPDAPAG